MEKFSRIKTADGEIKIKKDKILYDDNWTQIIKIDDWTIQKGKDFVICIPIILESNKFIIREEVIPPYKLVEGQERHLACVGGTIEDGETPEEALIRELEEEAGIVLRDDYMIDFMKPFFISKGSTVRCHAALLPLSEADYHDVVIKGDGSKWEKMSKTAYVDFKYINSLNTSDIITELMLMKLKEFMNIK